MTLYFITGNKSKFEEVQQILGDVRQLDMDLPEIQEIDAHKIIEQKLEVAQQNHGGVFIVEDTSLYLEALNGLPGPLIKWFMQTVGNEVCIKWQKRMKISMLKQKQLLVTQMKEERFSLPKAR